MKLQTNSRAGLTMFEVFVIVMILAIIFVMLMPTHTSNKARAPRIACTNNLKQVGLAFRIWSGDNNDKYPMQVSATNGAMEAVLVGNVAAVFQVMSNELSTPKILFCPTDKKRIQTSVFAKQETWIDGRVATFYLSNTNISYFVGVDAKDTLPQMFLAGDDNFLIGGKRGGYDGAPVQPGVISLTTNIPVAWSDERHERQGNIGLADGSVQGFSSSALRNALANTGDETNRLAFP